ncbi:hypothetical protein JX265_000358 [Neoarthrinium moseri]|uniref:Pisatin demethylase cytochrome P450 n=1 Tax=Neoarthrinium moseri TaxID=1658444 RepID=A0A9P9WYQ7_9PEZI|nr:uncharacterized protein JN550_000608 [Neoarthrinium moseri]KAI1851408.1 hypothetical protein JX266_003483 [Neoarthrinium moseri]KAI1878426.1 hypothetical protein JN550_000608 [Neoarthrinium moseri]KAI1881532.1 hypothetical protein JX265_000358 [Neoarthrinium moseri]
MFLGLGWLVFLTFGIVGLYGPIVRYGPNRYSINDPHAAKTIYGLGAQFAKSSWYSTWGPPGRWTIFADQNVHRHAQNRRMYQNTYSMSSLISYEPYVDECTDLFSDRLRELSQAGQSVDMGRWFQNYAFDVIGLITYSRRLGFLDQGEDIGGVISALENHLTYATLVGIFPWLHPICHFVQNRLLGGERGKGREYVLKFTLEQMAAFKAAPKSMPSNVEIEQSETVVESFLSKFQSKHSSEPGSFTQYHIQVGCAANMVAGSDTTAISLTAILYYLLSHPASLEKLRKEVDSSFQDGKLSTKPTFKESQSMPYLQAVIKEALRMHPATGLPLERVVPPGGATIAGRFFPEGTVVGINSWVEHRNTHIFGPDAGTFRPERWLDADSDQLSLMNRHWMPFGLGSRTCIGRHISMLEITKLVPRILRDFDFAIVEPIDSSKGIFNTHNMWFVKPSDFQVRLGLRAQSSQ